jgi:hypothetical protein
MCGVIGCYTCCYVVARLAAWLRLRHSGNRRSWTCAMATRSFLTRSSTRQPFLVGPKTVYIEGPSSTGWLLARELRDARSHRPSSRPSPKPEIGWMGSKRRGLDKVRNQCPAPQPPERNQNHSITAPLWRHDIYICIYMHMCVYVYMYICITYTTLQQYNHA